MSIRPRSTVYKDPSAVLVYEFDWSDWLGSAEISGSPAWTIAGSDSALTKDQESVVTGNKKARVRLAGGTVGVQYTLTCRITTNETPAQTDERSIFVTIKEQ